MLLEKFSFPRSRKSETPETPDMNDPSTLPIEEEGRSLKEVLEDREFEGDEEPETMENGFEDHLVTARTVVGSMARPVTAPAYTYETPAAATSRYSYERYKAPVTAPAAPSRPSKTGVEQQKLVVGAQINLSARISDCDVLHVEGCLEATHIQSRYMEITASGIVSGQAHVQEALISGTFEGDLIVDGALTITETGAVKGTIQYQSLQIERGGLLSGTLGVLASHGASAADTTSTAHHDHRTVSELRRPAMDTDTVMEDDLNAMMNDQAAAARRGRTRRRYAS